MKVSYPILAVILCSAQLAFAVTPHEGKVFTPGGLVDKNCVYELPQGARFDPKSGNVTRDDVLIERRQLCTPEQMGMPSHPSSSGTDQPPAINGWIEDTWATSYYIGGLSFFNYLHANWVVPKRPNYWLEPQDIYFFPSFEAFPADGPEIIQPVLEYNCPGCDVGTWSIAGWYCSSNQCVHSPFIDVNPGDNLTGEMWITSYVPREYTIRISDDTTGWWTMFTQTTSGFPFTAAQGGVLEVYGLGDCSEFPPDGYMRFQNIWISQAGPRWNDINWVAPNWTDNVDHNASPQCAYYAGHTVSGTTSEAWLFY